MTKRKAVERVIARIYKDRLAKTGRLPKPEDVRGFERQASKAAELADNRRGRK